MKKKQWLLVGTITLIGIFYATCLFKSREIPKYIFLITLDTTREDCFKYETRDNTITPSFASLASDGMYFKKAYSLTPITLPAHVSMFYSIPPHISGILNNGQNKDVNHPSLTTLLKNNGYQTGAVVSLGVVKSSPALKKQFDKYITNFTPPRWYRTAEEVNQDAFELIKEMKDRKSFFWIHYSDPHEPYYPPYYKGNIKIHFNDTPLYSGILAAQPLIKMDLKIKPGKNILSLRYTIPDQFENKKWISSVNFIHINFKTDPSPFPPQLQIKLPKNWKKKGNRRGKINYISKQKNSDIVFINNGTSPVDINLGFVLKMVVNPAKLRKWFYTQEVAFMDKAFKQLIEFLKKNEMFDQSAFVIIGDHGEGLGEYRAHYGHINYLNKMYTQVPLIIAGKGIQKKGRRDELVSILDTAPTILDLANLEQPKFMQGKSLLKKIQNKRLILETYEPEARKSGFSIIEWPHQIIYYPKRFKNQLELYNLKNDRYGIRNILQTPAALKVKIRLFNAIKKVAGLLLKMKTGSMELSPEALEILESLGYI